LTAMAGQAVGSVAMAQDDHARAIVDLRDAAGRWADLESPFEVARCQVLIGRALRALGDEESAVAEFEAASGKFAELGAGPAEREARRLLRPSAPAGLTAREVEVLKLVAAGRTNPEIASELVLSEKTVARHLSNIFAKLQVGSRTAAAAFAFDHHIV
ncbi:MAG: LuxR C-terminal-related transcriptional regulator, partial [Mycobacterium sp.]